MNARKERIAMKKQGSNIGINIIGIYFVVMSAITLFFNLLYKLKKLNLVDLITNINTIFLMFSYLVCGIAIMKRRLWAKYVGIFLLLWFSINNIPLIYATSGISKIIICTFAIIPIFIVYYMLRIKNSDHF